ncbi:MAG: TldD/PmbA family protein [Deltaproteobacteria bacterium]|nr:MAG: TldD/PmbA family protein [Deltaproteobacteria bacterium]
MSAVPHLDHFERFGVTENEWRRVLAEATALGADDADLYFEHTTATAVALSDRIVNSAHTSVDVGVGVRVVVGDQVGYAYTEELTLPAMLEAARIAREIARSGQASPLQVVGLQARAGSDFYPVNRRWAEVDVSERIPLIRAWEEAAFAADPRIEKVQANLSDADKYVVIVRADGKVVADYRPMTRGGVSCVLEDGGRREAGGYGVAARNDLSWYTPERQERLVREAVKRASDALLSVPAPAGEMPVVMAAGSSGILLHEAIGHGMEADFNRKGISIFADRIDTRIAPNEVTIVDDGTLPGARGAVNVDDEGSETEKTVLVENGTLRTFLHDRISARHYGVNPTGSGRRESFRHPVLPRMRCTYMENGPHDPSEIIKSVDKGIYCESFQNGQVAIGAGDFAFYVRQGYLIENGKLTQPVKDVNLIGNGPEVLAAIEMVGNDLAIDEGGWTCGKDGQSVPVSQGMPTVKVGKLSVGGGAR